MRGSVPRADLVSAGWCAEGERTICSRSHFAQRRYLCEGGYTDNRMTKLLEEAVAQVRTLPAEEQNRAAEVLMVFARDRRGYTLTVEQIEGIKHAMGQADRGEFASEERVQDIFGCSL